MSAVFKNIKKPYPCTDCNKAFEHNSVLQIHKRMHTGEKPFVCSLCDNSFSFKSALKKHMSKHTGERPFQCEQCGDNFSDMNSLGYHKRAHIKEPFKCSQCEKEFLEDSTYKDVSMHMKTHFRSYKCSHCVMAFSKNNQLEDHMAIHTGEKLYKCDNCSQTFSDHNVFKSHLKTHAVKKPYQCNYCDRAFEHNRDLLKHMNKNMVKHMRIKKNVPSNASMKSNNLTLNTRDLKTQTVNKETSMSNIVVGTNLVEGNNCKASMLSEDDIYYESKPNIKGNQVNIEFRETDKVDQNPIIKEEDFCDGTIKVNFLSQPDIDIKEEQFYFENGKLNQLIKPKIEVIDEQFCTLNNNANYKWEPKDGVLEETTMI